MSDKKYYSAPVSHESDVKKMAIWLVSFFSLLALTVILLIVFADTLAKKLPFSAEKQFIRPYEAMADYFFDEKPSSNETIIAEYLTELGSTLAEKMNVPEEYDLTFHYINNNTVNAFATLGGHIFIFRGLIEAMPDENSLSMVIAHEIAHIKNRDPLAAMGRGFALQMIYGFAVGDFSSGSTIALDGGEIGILYFGREQEQAADILGIHAINDLYGHVEGYDYLFSYILDESTLETSTEEENKKDIDWTEWLSTHPRLESRIEKLANYAEEKDFRAEGGKTLLPAYILTSIENAKKEKRMRLNKKRVESLDN